jgi:hypothetical protein
MSFNVDTNESHDTVIDKWTVLKTMPSKRGGLASVVINDSIYAFECEQPDRTFNNNEKYNTIKNKLTSEKSMPTARHGLVAVSFKDKIYVIEGGLQPGGSGTKINEGFHVGDVGRRK